MKTLSFAVPCFNSADYMDKCIESLLIVGDDIEIIIVDDGSTKDDTARIADEWAQRYPDIISVIHKANGGHGSAVNAGLSKATGLYFKVVDSDDWLDKRAMDELMPYLRKQATREKATDVVIGNYVYEKVHENSRMVMHYRNVFPEGEEFGWDDIGHFLQSQYLLMHSVIYRTDLLKDIGMQLPEHCFYVDNIFVYVPLPHVTTMYYRDVDMYRYFIGREDQSVNESTMLSRIDQQIRVTKTMIDSVDFESIQGNKKLYHYMRNYLSMMMCICSVFLRMDKNDADAKTKRVELWDYLETRNPTVYRHIRMSALNAATNLPTELGRRIGITGYRTAQRIFKFN